MKNAQDMYDVIFPLYIISKILGLAPFKLRKKTLTPHCGPVVVLRIIVIMAGMFYVAVMVEELKCKKEIAALALKCELYLGALMTFVILILAAFNQKHLINTILSLVKIDNHMKSVNIDITYKNSHVFVVIQMIITAGVFLLKIALQYFSHTSAMLIVYSAFNFVDYINTIMLFQYVNFLLLLRQRFVWLNIRLKRIRKYNHPICVNDMKKSLTSVMIVNCKNVSFTTKSELQLLLINLAKIYNKLCEVSRLINWTFNVQILITVGSRFVMITTQLINTYNKIRNPKGGNVVQYAVLSVYLALHFSKIFMLAAVSANTANKAKQTGIILHNIWEIMPDMKTEIEYFSLQILHQNLTFTGCGFFVLDYTLIYSIVGAVATYFVIVIQLEKTF